jgi:outer membrane protein assembly factor BamE (lipoprotein component of BamABCDE complex)
MNVRLDPIEKRVIRAVLITLGIVAVLAVSLAGWGRYQIHAEQKAAEQRRQYEAEMGHLMDEELVAEGMTRELVRATLGAPDSVSGLGELSERWYYTKTRNYGRVDLVFEHDRLVSVERKQ